jgi:hypothetical protein
LLSLVSFILTENPTLSEVVRRELGLASTVNAGSSVNHHLASKIVITLQTFVILSLTYWIAEEYLNNMYLRQYVSDVFQVDGLMFGILGTLLMLGSAGGVALRHRHSKSTVSLEIKAPSPMISASKKEEKTKIDSDFHPVVAAMKADMAERRLSFGSMAGAGAEQPSTAPVPSGEVRKASVLDQLTPNRQPPVTSPKPGNTAAPLPQQSPLDPRPQASAGSRIEQGGTLAQRPLPFLKPPESTGSTVLQPSQTPPSQVRTTVTTVITGIMPAQKKKDPASPEEKPGSQ